MYLYYLIGYKIDACKVKVDHDRVTKENSFVLALDGDVDFHPDAVELVSNKIFHAQMNFLLILRFAEIDILFTYFS